MVDIIEEIKRQQPFRSVLIIKSVEPLKARGAISGESFLVMSSEGKLYKLRYCSDENKAKEIEENIRLNPIAPKFYGREHRFLLFDWIEGEIPKPSPEIAYQVGKIMGEAHALEKIREDKDADDFFNDLLIKVGKANVFEEKIINRIKETYLKFKEKLKVDVVLEFHDVHYKNFKIDKDGTLYYVDEDGFGYKLKGLGLVKPLLKKDAWLKDYKKEFRKGYNEHHSDDYFDKDYQKFVLFVQLIRSISSKVQKPEIQGYSDYSKEKELILGML
jgi:hypothetical protein